MNDSNNNNFKKDNSLNNIFRKPEQSAMNAMNGANLSNINNYSVSSQVNDYANTVNNIPDYSTVFGVNPNVKASVSNESIIPSQNVNNGIITKDNVDLLSNNIDTKSNINDSNIKLEENNLASAINHTPDFHSIFGGGADSSLSSKVSDSKNEVLKESLRENNLNSEISNISPSPNIENPINESEEIPILDFGFEDNEILGTQEFSSNGVPTPNQNIGIGSSLPQTNLNNNQNNNTVFYENNKEIDDEELLKTFIGKNYNKITTKKFNFSGFFFTILYMFYRRMFVYALISFLIDFALSNLVSVFGGIVGYIIVNVLFMVATGLLINKIYISYAKEMIIKTKLNNPQKSADELKNMCAAKGRTSIGQMFLGLLVSLLIGFLIALIIWSLGFTLFVTNLFTGFSKNINTANPETNGTYDGWLSYDTSVNMANEFYIIVPSKFEDDSSDNNYSYSYSGDSGVFNECKLSLNAVQGYSDANKLISQMAKYNDVNDDIIKENINNNNWYSFSLNNSFGKTYYYGTNKNNKVYLMTYKIEEDAPSDCESYQAQIINSIKSK